MHKGHRTMIKFLLLKFHTLDLRKIVIHMVFMSQQPTVNDLKLTAK